MAKSITIYSEDWHSANLSEETAKIIDKCVDDNHNVTLEAPERFYLRDPSEDNINIIFSSNYIMSKDGVCLCENRQMINSIIDVTVRYNNSTFRVNLNTSVEYYNGIGVFAENVSRNSSRICIAKAIFPNTIVFAIEPDTYNIENNIESILKTLLPFAMITSEEEWNMQMLKHHRDNIAEIMMTPYINKKQNIMQEISAKNSAIEKCHANIRIYTEELGELEKELISIDKLQQGIFSKIFEDIDNVNKLNGVRKTSGIETLTDGILVVETEPIICKSQNRRYLFGRYSITLNFLKSSVIFKNLDENMCRQSYWGFKCQHPHIDSTGSACLGNIKTDIAAALKDMSFSYATILALSFLRSVNIGDAAGKYAYHWPLVDEDGNIIRDSSDDLERCCVCGNLYPEEESDAIENGWNKCDICGESVCGAHTYSIEIDGHELTVCRNCKQINIKVCPICGQIKAESDMVTTYFGSNVCSDCAKAVTVISPNETEHLTRVNIMATEDEIASKIDTCAHCGNRFIKSNDSDYLCYFCNNDMSIKKCECCCLQALESDLINVGDDSFVCDSCYRERDYHVCINCMSEHPASVMVAIDSTNGIYQCQECYEQLLEGGNSENV